MRYYPYEEFLRDIKKLAKEVADFDTYVAVARGGLTPAHFLAEANDIRRVYALSSIGYDGQKKLGRPLISQIPDLKDARKILIVEDIVDSGDTLMEVLKALRSRYPQKHFATAALFYKESAKLRPDFFVQYADEWIDFFWTRDINGSDDRQL